MCAIFSSQVFHLCNIPFSALSFLGGNDDEKRGLDAEFEQLQAEECELRRVLAAAGAEDDNGDQSYANEGRHTEEEEVVALALLQDKWAREDELFAVEIGLLDPSELTAEQGRGSAVVTVLLQCCYSAVALLLHCCYTVVTLLLHCCYTVVTLLLHCCYTVVTLLLSSCR
jgi:hypothetical protein